MQSQGSKRRVGGLRGWKRNHVQLENTLPSTQPTHLMYSTSALQPILTSRDALSFAEQRSWYSVWLRAGRSGHRIPVGAKFSRTCPDRPWGPLSLLYNGSRVFPGGKERPGRDADPSPPSSAVVKKGQSYTSTPPMGRTARTQPQCLYKGALYLYQPSFNYAKESVKILSKFVYKHLRRYSNTSVFILTLRRLMSYIYIYMEHPFLMFLDHTQRRSTVGRTPLDE